MICRQIAAPTPERKTAESVAVSNSPPSRRIKHPVLASTARIVISAPRCVSCDKMRVLSAGSCSVARAKIAPVQERTPAYSSAFSSAASASSMQFVSAVVQWSASMNELHTA